MRADSAPQGPCLCDDCRPHSKPVKGVCQSRSRRLGASDVCFPEHCFGRQDIAYVVASNMASCPSCAVQANIRVWLCGCQGVSYPDHLEECALPDGYFDTYNRYCQELQAHGKNPQTHLAA